MTEATLEEIDSDLLAVLLLVPEAEDAVATMVNTEPSASDAASLASAPTEGEAEPLFEAAELARAVSTLRRQSL